MANHGKAPGRPAEGPRAAWTYTRALLRFERRRVALLGIVGYGGAEPQEVQRTVNLITEARQLCQRLESQAGTSCIGGPLP